MGLESELMTTKKPQSCGGLQLAGFKSFAIRDW